MVQEVVHSYTVLIDGLVHEQYDNIKDALDEADYLWIYDQYRSSPSIDVSVEDELGKMFYSNGREF